MATNHAAEELAEAQADGRLKTDPSIGVSDLQNVLEAFLKFKGDRNFQKVLDDIAAEGVSWTSRPKVCIFLKQVCVKHSVESVFKSACL